jgi:hypothetical protein
MARKLVTERGSAERQFGLRRPTRTTMCAKGRSGSTGLGRILSMVRGSWIARRRKVRRAQVVAIRCKPRQQTSVISGREGHRPRNTTPNPYPALCRAGSRDGQFGGNALGRACSLTYRNSRRNHTAGTSEAPATSLQAPRISHTPRMRDRCPTERGTHGNTVLERNWPVHSRRKNTLMIFVGVSPFRESGSGNVSSCPLIVAWVPAGGSAIAHQRLWR